MNCSWMLLFFWQLQRQNPKAKFKEPHHDFCHLRHFLRKAILCDLLGLVEWHIPMSKLCERPDYLGTDRSRNTTLNGPGNHSCHSFACVSWFAHVSLSDTFSNLQQMSPNISKCLTIPRSSDLRLGILGMLRFDSPNLCFWHYMDLHGW